MEESQSILSDYKNSTRLFVIEKVINLELEISATLCLLLKIELEDSKSFGTSSQAMSFDQKATLLSDIEWVEPEMKKMFKCVMQVRNKFAHVAYIKTFENLFTKSSVGNQVKNQLDKWFLSDEEKELPYNEGVYIRAFEVLVNKCLVYLYKINSDVVTYESFNDRANSKRMKIYKLTLDFLYSKTSVLDFKSECMVILNNEY